MPDIFDINFQTQEKNILAPSKRLPKMLAYLYSILYPIQWLRDLLLGDYKTGANYTLYNAFTTYNKNDRVLYYDHAAYECNVNGTVTGIAGPASDPVAWTKIQDLFIGLDERIKYNSQIIMLEYELNKYYFVTISAPQIYIGNNSVSNNVFVMGNTGPFSSAMSNNSANATSYMYNAPTFVASAPNFTVYVPTSLLSTLGLTLGDQKNNVRQFVDKYKLAGVTYDVQPY